MRAEAQNFSLFTGVQEEHGTLMESMHYASYIQKGILPQERHFNRIFEAYFLLYRPQQIIGGDLYWVGQKDKLKVFAVGDCTGHGVSGAMLSVLAISFLNYLVFAKEHETLSDVLFHLDRKWIETFHQGVENYTNNDWLDIGICVFNTETRELRYAGAFNKLVVFHQDEVNVYPGNRYPIGGWQLERNRSYYEYKIQLPESASVYLFSDGYKDQLSSIHQKKIGWKKFLDLLSEVVTLPMDVQCRLLNLELKAWMGEEKQTDDICVLGVKL